MNARSLRKLSDITRHLTESAYVFTLIELRCSLARLTIGFVKSIIKSSYILAIGVDSIYDRILILYVL